MWLKELNLFFVNVTQRIEPLVQCDSKNVTFNKSMFPRIDRFFLNDSKTWTLFSFRCDSKNWTLFFPMWLNELNPFLDMTQRIETSFLHDSKTWAFLTWLRQLVLFCLDLPFLFCVGVEPLKLWLARPDSVPLYTLKKKQLVHFWYDSKNWTLFSWMWRKELNPFSDMTQRIELSF